MNNTKISRIIFFLMNT